MRIAVMVEPAGPTPREMEILKVLWHLGPATVLDVSHRLPPAGGGRRGPCLQPRANHAPHHGGKGARPAYPGSAGLHLFAALHTGSQCPRLPGPRVRRRLGSVADDLIAVRAAVGSRTAAV